MSEPETLYTSPYEPDPSNALHVLALLLITEAAFMAPGDGEEVRMEIRGVLDAAKREFLLEWYRRRR